MGNFSFNLPYTDEMIEMAENQINMSKEDIKKIKDPEERKRIQKQFDDALDAFLNEALEGKEPPSKGSTGGAVNKKRKGNKIISPKKNKKIKLAGRLAKRGYGKARK
tara:strand:- start:324 stop:644 length:321 start_codon:yes stop_codon:yes gene_type:complete